MIDKNRPLKLVSDKDQRLLKDGEMVAATNVTISQRGVGTDSILKTVRGFNGVLFDLLNGEISAVDADVTVIGKVEDPQLGYIYLFVATTADGVHTHDMIVRVDANNYDPSAASTAPLYLTVFRNDWLNFDQDGFVSADVVNKAFQQDGVVKSILYFTDNNNPPRKINVDRALAGDYSALSSSELDIALGSMRAASTRPPSFVFETDFTVNENNFEQNQFQFATQIVYTDGEVSALSPYSKLAISQASVFGGIEDTDYGVARNTQNVCVIKTNVAANHPDISKVRLLARNGNSGGFFVVDEFDPSSNLSRYIAGGSKVVYDSNSQEYTFYNDSLGRTISDTESQKLYDNVPQKAQGQTIAGSRLMYSNYTEGYPNHPIHSSASITPVYANNMSGANSFIASGDTALIFSHAAGNMNVQLDLENGSLLGPSTEIPAGTVCIISFAFGPTFTATAATGNLIDIPVAQLPGQPPSIGNLTVSSLDFDTLQTSGKKVEIITRLPEDKTPSQLADFIHLTLDEYGPFYLDYTLTNVSATGTNVSNTTFSCTARVFFKFGEDTTASGDTIIFKPRITRIKLIDLVIADVGSTYFAPDPNDSVLSNVFDRPGNSQSEVTYSSVTDPASSDFISIDSVGATATFKSGANHAFGIVYYDKYGRSGFVNELGAEYVKSIPERHTTPGSVAMRFDLSSSSFEAPSWADSYQIVYSGSSVSDVFQYTVGGAYYRRLTTDTAGTYDIDDSTHNIYVSLKTLDQYKRDKDVTLDYSFTKGDKLRIISYANSTNTTKVYNPLSSDSNVMEFDVVGVETIESAPIRNVTTAETIADRSPHNGTFLVLSAPAVEGSAGNAGAVEKYVGFDWYQITGEDYNPTDTVSSVTNYWNRDVLVEIITPKKSTSEKIYYEIGERRTCGVYKDPTVGPHGPAFVVQGGDVYYKPRACKAPVYSSGWSFNNNENPENWTYRTKYLEDGSVSDLYQSKAWDRGRAHSVFQKAATANRYNSITYSEAYADDTSKLSLSSFTPSLANFFDLPSENGKCSFIGKLGDNLLSIQENKCSLIAINKDVIQTGTQSGLVSLSTNVLNNLTQYSGFYGTENPESVLIRDSICYFADLSQSAIVKIGQKMEVLSEQDIKSALDLDFASLRSKSGAKKVYTGYDPEDSVLYVTMRTPTETIRTYGYNEALGIWQSRYTFYPKMYASLKNTFFICQYDTTGTHNYFVHYQDETAGSNKFPGSTDKAESSFAIMCNDLPSSVKAYKSLSIEGDSAWDTSLTSSSGQSISRLQMPATAFSEKEDAFYIKIPRDVSSSSTSEYIPIGTSESAFGARITMASNLRGKHIPIGYQLYKGDDALGYIKITREFSGETLDSRLTSIDRSTNELVFDNSPSLAGISTTGGDTIFLAAEKILTGDQIRGHYIRLELAKTPSGTAREEVYSVNVTYEESKANHGGTQQ